MKKFEKCIISYFILFFEWLNREYNKNEKLEMKS